MKTGVGIILFVALLALTTFDDLVKRRSLSKKQNVPHELCTMHVNIISTTDTTAIDLEKLSKLLSIAHDSDSTYTIVLNDILK